jgi:hypothetical protein
MKHIARVGEKKADPRIVVAAELQDGCIKSGAKRLRRSSACSDV